jgi:hypothetical protein
MLQATLLFMLATSAAAQLNNLMPIGTGQSQGKTNSTEQTLFEYQSETFAVMTHFWTAGSSQVERTTFRYYVDGEETPSIEYIPSQACGVGFDNQAGPWANKWFGRGATLPTWFHNFRIPFKSIKITFQLETGEAEGAIWSIVRGLENYKFTIGDIPVPENARMKLIKHENVTLDTLEFVDLVNIPKGAGMLFLTMMQVSSINFNFMEGCFHFYNQKYVEWPGMLMSTGMEDYYDSAFYFSGGDFHAPVSGSTFQQKATNTTPAMWSGYRFHEMDPMVFSEGMRFQWRNGDMTDMSTGLKCTLLKGGRINGSPGPSQLTSLMWVYQW